MQHKWWDYHRWCGQSTLTCCLKKFELFALLGNGDVETLGTSACAQARGLRLTPASHLVKLLLPNIYNYHSEYGCKVVVDSTVSLFLHHG